MFVEVVGGSKSQKRHTQGMVEFCAKQYARRELHPSKEAWLGKTINPKKVSYWDLPWEIEAHGREVGLFVRYCEENKLGKYKWTNI
jgi:hypothetical protein